MPLVVMAVWQDGRIVWSEDSVRGGRPFLEGRLSETDLITLRTGLETAGVYGADAPVPIPTPSMFTAMTRIVIHEDDALIAGILPEEPSVKRGGDVPSEDEQEHLQQVAIEYQAPWGQVLETLYQAKDAASDPQETDIQFAIRFRLRGSGQ